MGGFFFTFLPQVYSAVRGIPALAALALTLALLGCATGAMDRLLPKIEDLGLARHYFGEPTVQKENADGTVRCEWAVDRAVQIPGQYVEQQIYLGSDEDGFPKIVTREVFVPEHTVRQQCRMIIIAARDGRVLEISRWGSHCDALLIRPVTY